MLWAIKRGFDPHQVADRVYYELPDETWIVAIVNGVGVKLKANPPHGKGFVAANAPGTFAAWHQIADKEHLTSLLDHWHTRALKRALKGT